MRLDEYLVKNKITSSRNKANMLIEESKVLINGQVINKKSYQVNEDDNVKIIENLAYVSRAGKKLDKAIKTFNVQLKDKIILDVGCSSGGFSDVCLQNNAKKIYCIDVNDNQLNNKIKNDSRVINLCPLNIKDLTKDKIKDSIDIVVSDLSFISSYYMFLAISKISLSDNVIIISLIKPQFELDKNILDKTKGVIKDTKHHLLAISKVKSFAKKFGFEMFDLIESPIVGAKKGNKEFLGLFKHV